MATLIEYIETPARSDEPVINLKWAERYLSVIAGVKVGFSGVKHLFSSPFTSILKIGAGGYLVNRGITGHCDLYSLAGKINTDPVTETIRTSVIVNRPRTEIYEFWRKLDNLPLFMTHLKSVEVIDETLSRWRLKVPADIAEITWDAKLTSDEPGNMIAWESLPDSMIRNAGKIRFIETPGNETMIHVAITYQPPAGGIGASLAYILNPLFLKMVEDDVQNFKRYMEVGHITDELISE